MMTDFRGKDHWNQMGTASMNNTLNIHTVFTRR
jgi:hypothetical protein